MIDSLDLKVYNAEAILAAAIEFDVYSDDMPDNTKDKLEEANKVVALAVESYSEDGIRADHDDEDIAAAGEQIEAIFELAGVEADESDIEYGDAPDLKGTAKLLKKFAKEFNASGLAKVELTDAANDDDDDDDEAAMGIDDIIEGYDDLNPATKIKKIKALDLDPDDDEDYNTLIAIQEHEESQDQPASRVLNFIEELIPEEEEEDEDEDDDDETAAEAGDDEADDDDDADEDEDAPWPGYDELSPSKIKKELKALVDDDEDPLSADQVDFIISYEEDADEPREDLIDWLKDLRSELSGDDSDDEDDEFDPFTEKELMKLEKEELRKVFIKTGGDEDEFPKRFTDAGRKRVVNAILAAQSGEVEPEAEPVKKRGPGRPKKTRDPDESNEVDEAVAKDDEADERKARRNGSGKLVLTRAMVLAALAEGEIEIG